MEDIIKALLDVTRAQHSATEGSEERPFDINDIIEMALNITGRPEEPEEQQELSDAIQKMAESLAPDIFPPKTFEEMDDSERAASAVNMIEERLRNGGRRREETMQQSQPAQESVFEQEAQHPVQPENSMLESFMQSQGEIQPGEQAGLQPETQAEAQFGLQSESGNEGTLTAGEDSYSAEDYGNGNMYDMFGQDDVNHQEAANLNDLIYNNFMQMMGLNDPKVEYPFDRSQVRYGKEKTATEMLAEDEANKAEERALEEQRRRPVSAWELAQAAVDKDEEAHQKEEYEPKEMQMPETKSASQLAAEAIAKAREEDQLKLEAEKRAERLMEEARKRGKDPMEFALHQQEILNYMEKNSDELVSFEDYEDLSPEEKLEIERELYKEKQLAAGVAPEDIGDVSDEVKKEVGIVPQQAAAGQGATETAQSATGNGAADSEQEASQPSATPAFSDNMLRMISQEVVQENADMILSEDANADLDKINETIFENLKQLMSQSGGNVSQEDMESLIGEVISRNTSDTSSEEVNIAPEQQNVAVMTETETATMAFEAGNGNAGSSAAVSVTGGGGAQPEAQTVAAEESQTAQPLSAVDLARAAQQAAKPEPQEKKETKSAVEIAKEAQEIAALKKALATPEAEDELREEDLNFDEFDLDEEEEGNPIEALKEKFRQDENVGQTATKQSDAEQETNAEDTAVMQGESEEKESEAEVKTESESDLEQKVEAEEASENRQEGEPEISKPEEAAYVEEQSQEIAENSTEATASVESKAEDEEEYEYVDPGELVLGEHTQAEIDEALENLASLGLEGEVYERAKRMLLLELAGSEVALDAWLEEQENGKKKKAVVSALDTEEDNLDDLEDIDEDDLERELELAMDEDFVEEELEEESSAESEEISEKADKESAEETASEDREEGAKANQEQAISEEEKVTSMENAESLEETAESTETSGAETTDVSQETAKDVEEAETVERTSENAGNKSEVSDKNAETLTENSETSCAQAFEHLNSAEKAGDTTEESTQNVSGQTGESAEYISESEENIQVEKTRPEKKEMKSAHVKKSSYSEHGLHSRKHKNIVKRKEKAAPEKEEREFTAVIPTGKKVEEKEFQVSIRNPFVLKNSASFMDKFEEYIVDTQENRKLSTGFKRLDAMLRYGLHKGSYFVDSMPQYLKNGFMQQIADRAAESGVDVLYISTELSRYDLMVDTISRLSYEMNKKDEDKAVSAMAIMTGEKGADIHSLKDELNWYRGRISEHLFVLDQEAVSEYVENMEDASASAILEELIRSIVTEGAHKPVVFIDNIENILSVEDSEDMKPLMDGIRKLAKELGIPIIMSYGYAQVESESELDPAEIEYHESLGNMCDVYLELKYADMITEDYEEVTEEDIEEMVDNGEMLLINVLLHKNRRTMRASCQIQATPKFNYYEE